MFTRVKGTQDFLDVRLFDFIVDCTKKRLTLHNFTPIATPILEPTDLFKRSLGLETDVVTKQMFTIDTGEGGEQICLRPEATASTVRAFVQNGVQTVPWKVFSYGPMFRYERPQKGRYRQFHQINLELIGASSMAHDAQCIAMLDQLFQEDFKLSNYALKINFLGCFEDRKVYKKLLHDFLSGVVNQLCATCKQRKETNIMRVFDCKNIECQKIYADAPVLIESLCAGCTTDWQQLQDLLEAFSVSFQIDPMLVRGLDYYNKTVFEFVSDDLGAQSAFCGGGRYDQLVSQLGGKIDQPSLGAALGIERILLLLENKPDLPLPESPALHVVLPMAVEQQGVALLLADALRVHGLCADVLLEGDSVKSMMRKVNKMGAAYALIIGADEQKNNTVTIKNMMTGDQKTVAQNEVIGHLK